MLWPKQTQGGAGTEDLDAAKLAERRVESRSSAAGSRVLARGIQRDGDIGLRGRHEIDRQTLLLEDLECVGEKSHLMPHAGAVHRDQRDALLDGDGFDLRGAVGDIGADHRAFEARRLRRIHMQRNLVLPHRQDAARMQDLGAVARDFLRFVVVQRAQQPRRRDGARIGAEQARHVGPDLEARRGQLGREIGGRGVRAAAPKQHRIARPRSRR